MKNTSCPLARPLSRAASATFVVIGLTIGADAQIRTIDGSNNNLANPDMGKAKTMLARPSTLSYGDGLSTPAGASRPSARLISNAICAQSGTTTNPSFSASDMVWQWGQFLDHDIDLTEPMSPVEPFDIAVPMGDAFFDPFFTGTQVIPLDRSIFEVDGSGIRQQLNEITTWIDGSNVYGSDQVRADELRTFVGGRLKISAGQLLPFNTAGLGNAGGTDSTLFLAGDPRANEQIGLAAMHTLFVREHNFYADMFNSVGFDDETCYQNARILVWAELQAITYNEFLPVVIGAGTIPPYTGYDDTVDARINNFFSTASYRFGHTMLSPTLKRLDGNMQTIPAGDILLRDAFFAPQELINEGIDSILRGLTAQEAQRVDTLIIDDVRNFLFGPPGAGGFDLASLNIQRGRDHGLADYNQARIDFGLAPVATFADITSDPALQTALQTTYGSVNDIDGWLGGLAEDAEPGALVGELIQRVLRDQFVALRDGDRFWYENALPFKAVQYVNRQTLARVIRRNTRIDEEISDNVFMVPK